jgi:histidinol dehydrogenase
VKVSRHTWDGAAPEALAAELRGLAPPLADVAAGVTEIIRDVEERGDAAVRELTEKHDSVEPMPERIQVEFDEIERALDDIDSDLARALQVSAANVRAVAEAQLGEAEADVDLPDGQRVAIRRVPVRSAAIYVPGGRAAYPSTVLMGCIPATVAGVQRLVVASPPGPDGRLPASVLAACAIAGARAVYTMGGAQAIAALAIGTETVQAVDLIAGPGNRHVQEAKRQLAGRVGIDGIAGPSELMVVIDESGEPAWAALDLCAQAEHGDDGLLVCVSTERGTLAAVEAEVQRVAAERPSVTDAPLALVELPGLDQAIELADALAPEHLELMCEDADELAARARTAGCVFAGAEAATAFGDYAVGSNHVLPTGGAGRFQGPLGPDAFRRSMPVVSLPPAAAAALAPTVRALASAEGLPVHAESAQARVGSETQSKS